MLNLKQKIKEILEEEFFWDPEVNDVNIRLERMFKQYIEELIGEDEHWRGKREMNSQNWGIVANNRLRQEMRKKLKEELG